MKTVTKFYPRTEDTRTHAEGFIVPSREGRGFVVADRREHPYDTHAEALEAMVKWLSAWGSKHPDVKLYIETREEPVPFETVTLELRDEDELRLIRNILSSLSTLGTALFLNRPTSDLPHPDPSYRLYERMGSHDHEDLPHHRKIVQALNELAVAHDLLGGRKTS